MKEKNTVKALLVPVGGAPREIALSSGGICQALGCEMFDCAHEQTLRDVEVTHIVDDFGKVHHAKPNRAVYDEDGNLIDVICGDFLIAAFSKGELVDLPQEALESYAERYRDILSGLVIATRFKAVRFLNGETPVNFGSDRLRYALDGRNLMREYMDRYKGEGYWESRGVAIERWLDYWLDFFGPKKTPDLHELCFEDEELARLSDTLVSLWSPLKMALQISPSSPWYGAKTEPTKSEENLKDIREHLFEYLPIGEFEGLYRLADMCELDYNVWVLPDKAMQCRGGMFFDEVAPSIAALFPGGPFESLLGERNLYEYLAGEGVTRLFQGDLYVSNLLPVIPGAEPGKAVWATGRYGLKCLIEGMINTIWERVEVFKFAEAVREAPSA